MARTGPSDDDLSPGLPLVILPEHCGQGGARESDAGVPAGELVHEPEQANRAPGDPELKRELEEAPEPPGKRNRVELLEAYSLQLPAPVRQRQWKEATAKDFVGPDAARLQQATQKEINNSHTATFQAATEVESTTPQGSRDSVVFVAQVLASMRWTPGFLDFTQGFHSGDAIERELYCFQPREGIPGAHPRQLLKLLKTCCGLTDGPLAWYRHLARRLVEDFGYVRSLADPSVFLLHEAKPKP